MAAHRTAGAGAILLAIFLGTSCAKLEPARMADLKAGSVAGLDITGKQPSPGTLRRSEEAGVVEYASWSDDRVVMLHFAEGDIDEAAVVYDAGSGVGTCAIAVPRDKSGTRDETLRSYGVELGLPCGYGWGTVVFETDCAGLLVVHRVREPDLDYFVRLGTDTPAARKSVLERLGFRNLAEYPVSARRLLGIDGFRPTLHDLPGPLHGFLARSPEITIDPNAPETFEAAWATTGLKRVAPVWASNEHGLVLSTDAENVFEIRKDHRLAGFAYVPDPESFFPGRRFKRLPEYAPRVKSMILDERLNVSLHGGTFWARVTGAESVLEATRRYGLSVGDPELASVENGVAFSTEEPEVKVLRGGTAGDGFAIGGNPARNGMVPIERFETRLTRAEPRAVAQRLALVLRVLEIDHPVVETMLGHFLEDARSWFQQRLADHDVAAASDLAATLLEVLGPESSTGRTLVRTFGEEAKPLLEVLRLDFEEGDLELRLAVMHEALALKPHLTLAGQQTQWIDDLSGKLGAQLQQLAARASQDGRRFAAIGYGRLLRRVTETAPSESDREQLETALLEVIPVFDPSTPGADALNAEVRAELQRSGFREKCGVEIPPDLDGAAERSGIATLSCKPSEELTGRFTVRYKDEEATSYTWTAADRVDPKSVAALAEWEAELAAWRTREAELGLEELGYLARISKETPDRYEYGAITTKREVVREDLDGNPEVIEITTTQAPGRWVAGFTDVEARAELDRLRPQLDEARAHVVQLEQNRPRIAHLPQKKQFWTYTREWQVYSGKWQRAFTVEGPGGPWPLEQRHETSHRFVRVVTSSGVKRFDQWQSKSGVENLNRERVADTMDETLAVAARPLLAQIIRSRLESWTTALPAHWTETERDEESKWARWLLTSGSEAPVSAAILAPQPKESTAPAPPSVTRSFQPDRRRDENLFGSRGFGSLGCTWAPSRRYRVIFAGSVSEKISRGVIGPYGTFIVEGRNGNQLYESRITSVPFEIPEEQFNEILRWTRDGDVFQARTGQGAGARSWLVGDFLAPTSEQSYRLESIQRLPNGDLFMTYDLDEHYAGRHHAWAVLRDTFLE